MANFTFSELNPLKSSHTILITPLSIPQLLSASRDSLWNYVASPTRSYTNYGYIWSKCISSAYPRCGNAAAAAMNLHTYLLEGLSRVYTSPSQLQPVQKLLSSPTLVSQSTRNGVWVPPSSLVPRPPTWNCYSASDARMTTCMSVNLGYWPSAIIQLSSGGVDPARERVGSVWDKTILVPQGMWDHMQLLYVFLVLYLASNPRPMTWVWASFPGSPRANLVPSPSPHVRERGSGVLNNFSCHMGQGSSPIWELKSDSRTHNYNVCMT